MRILFVSPANSTHTMRWVNELHFRGHKMQLISNANHRASPDSYDPSIRVYYLRFPGNLGYFLNATEAKKICRNFDPDIINVHYASGYGTLARLAKLRPCILSVWGSDVYDFPFKSKLHLNLIKKNLAFASVLASTSIAMSEQVKLIMGNNLEVSITPFGVETNKFKPLPAVKDGYFRFGVVKSLEPVYGIEFLIRSFAMYYDNYQKFDNKHRIPILVIYGKGSQKSHLKSLILELGLEDRVFLQGFVSNDKLPVILNNFDVFCAGSKRESFGVSVIEAMSVGLPVLATSTAGFEEVMVDGETGYLIPYNDIHSMAEKMMALYMSPEKRNKFGLAGRKRVMELYEWKHNVSQMEHIYHQFRKQRDILQ